MTLRDHGGPWHMELGQPEAGAALPSRGSPPAASARAFTPLLVPSPASAGVGLAWSRWESKVSRSTFGAFTLPAAGAGGQVQAPCPFPGALGMDSSSVSAPCTLHPAGASVQGRLGPMDVPPQPGPRGSTVPLATCRLPGVLEPVGPWGWEAGSLRSPGPLGAAWGRVLVEEAGPEPCPSCVCR